jgi:phage terminase large subunit-like protein
MTTPVLDGSTLARWQRRPIEFIEEVLRNPATGKPYELFEAQRRFFEHAWQLDDAGRLLYPDQCLSGPKKLGKTETAAMHTLATVWVLGGRNAEAYICANDFEQAQGRCFTAIKRIIEASPLLRPEAKITADRITFPATGATITALTSNAASAAGGHPTTSVHDELFGAVSEPARRIYEEMVPTPSRRVSCRLVTSVAGYSDESVLLRELYERGMQLPEIALDLRAGDGLLFYWTHEVQASWQTPEWVEQMRKSLRPSQFRRMILNEWVSSAEQAFVSMELFDRCVTGPGPVAANKALPIFIGIDASSKLDSTAVVAVLFDRLAKQVRLVWHQVFVPTANEPVSFEAIEEAVIDLSRRFTVRTVLYDPWAMQASAQRLKARGLPMKEFAQTAGNLTAASAALYDAIVSGALVAYPSAELRNAVSQSITVETARGLRISKANAKKSRIDVVIALSMATFAAMEDAARPRGFLQTDGWQSPELEERPMAEKWESPADRRQREMLDRVRQPPAGAPVDVIMQRLALSDRQQRMVDQAVELVPMPMRTKFLRAVCDRLAPLPADGAVDAALNIALDRMRREVMA